MRLPFTKYGLPQVVIYPILVLVVMVVLFAVLRRSPLVLVPLEIILCLVFVWMLSFFRDPSREIKPDEAVLYSPADGTITDISVAEDSEAGGRALKIGMFLSIFNVHINRVPCAARVERVTYKKGRFKNAMAEDSGRVNESNGILFVRAAEPRSKLLVRQVSGAVARHIVCEAQAGGAYRQGEPFGMIKFGSRTELYLPVAREEKGVDGTIVKGVSDNVPFEVCVKIGEPVRAGLSPLIRYLP